jgi:hypothetical protein
MKLAGNVAEPSVGVTKYLKVINGELVEVKAQAR